ncbi:cupin domain-containing protein [Sphingomonas solaris]|uniref:Cupin domain-containing protein n=1 Tax=Alterirhizorhabdus solaris TaxID=2529389 RepID=A0A558RBB7_9SPHN|nr:cupin domain-containing protein [Sphingomonas solaris]TVV76660.1 cupin domain-containing protein [Sphingomonas solaris]
MPIEAQHVDSPDDVEITAADSRETFRVFRAADAPGVIPAKERGTMRADYVPHPMVEEGLQRFVGAGVSGGAMARVLFSSADMHVSYAWFKSGFPLPLHSHDKDCFYQVIAGSMRVGTEELGKGDGLLIPGGVPYTVTPGAEGVEFIEVRPNGDYDTRYRGKTEKYWDRIVATLHERQKTWETEPAPFGLLQPGA